MERLTGLILLFFIYSFAGWCIEVTLKYLQYHRFINRGFLTGPVCPIYGCGAVLITVAAGCVMPFDASLGTTFVLSFFLCGILEYLTSYIMEKQFHARWWDYGQKPMNLHGRVWIGNLILFGLGGVIIIHLVNPLIYTMISSVSLHAQEIVAACLLAVFIADNITTHFILRLVKAGIEKSEADNTEEIGREIRLLLSDKSIFHRRFADAYPEVVYRTDRINARIAAVKAETERICREAEQRLKDQKQLVMSSLESTSAIKSTIISKQDALIGLLYDEQAADARMQALMADILQEKARLESHPLSQIAKASPLNKR